MTSAGLGFVLSHGVRRELNARLKYACTMFSDLQD